MVNPLGGIPATIGRAVLGGFLINFLWIRWNKWVVVNGRDHTLVWRVADWPESMHAAWALPAHMRLLTIGGIFACWWSG